MSIWTSLEPASTTVDPGSSTTVQLRLHNTGDIVDEYRCVPVGDIAPYVTVDPPTIRLFPGTTGTVVLTFAPPRTPDATAGPNPYGVQVIPAEHPGATSVCEGNLTITPFTEVRAELVPHTVKGRFRGRPKLAIDNLGNTKLTASVIGNENGDQLSYEIHPANVQIEPGRAAFVKTTLRPRQITWFGRKENRPYQLAVQRSGNTPVDVDGVYVQRGVLPRWLATFLTVALALTIMFVVAWFAYKPSVRSLATEKLEQSAATSLPTPSAPPPPPSAAPPAPSPSPEQPKTDSGGGGAPKPKKTEDPANAKNVLIKNPVTGKCADIPNYDRGSLTGPVEEFTCNGTNQDNQIWDLDVRYPKGGPGGASLFQIRNIKDDYCMDLPDIGSQPVTTHIAEFTCNGTKADNQLWWLEKQSDGHYWVHNYASNHLCLNVAGLKTGGDGAALTIDQCVNTDDRQWDFVKAEPQP